jgi:hypothetical protein
MRLRTNSIVDKDNGGNVNFNNPPDLNNNPVIVNGNLNVVGVSTINGQIDVNDISLSGIVTAASFVGDGSGLSVPTASVSKSIALKYIIADPPLRS